MIQRPGILALGAVATLSAIAVGYITARVGLPVLLLPAFLILLTLAFTKPHWGLAVFWLSVFWMGPGFSLGVHAGPFQVNVMDAILAVYFVPSAMRVAAGRMHLLRPAWPLISMVSFFLLTLLRGLVLNPVHAVATDARPFLYVIVVWLWVAALTAIEGRSRVATVLITTFALGSVGAFSKALLILLGVLSRSNDPIAAQYYDLAFFDTLGGERIILLGADTLLTVAVPILTASVLCAKSHQQSLILLGGLVSAVWGLVLSFTRATWIGAGVGSAIVIFSYLRANGQARGVTSTRRLLVILGALAVSLFVAGNAVIGRSEFSLWTLMQRRLSGDYDLGGGLNGLTRYRVGEAQAMIGSWLESPLFGKGMGGTYRYLLFSAGVWDEQQWSHNGWLWVLLKGGIAGLVLVTYPFLALLRRPPALRPPESIQDESVALRVALLGGLTAFVIMSLTDNRFASPEGGAFLGMWLGLMQATDRRANGGERASHAATN